MSFISGNLWLRQLRRKLFVTLDLAAPAPATTHARRKARSFCRPRIEVLEDRLAPTVNVLLNGSELDIEAANSSSAPTTIDVDGTHGARTHFFITSNPDTISVS